VEVGDVVEDFSLRNKKGEQRTLSSYLEHGPVVLFFYPAAMSSGCTAESCHFRDLAGEFGAFGATRLGISGDSVARQAEFAERHHFGFPLLSDEDGAVARRFGVRRRFGPLKIRRRTFVIGRDRRLLGVIKSETRMASHADRALAVLRRAG
jgi:thioredoxin-dependent peroxiredoxin